MRGKFTFKINTKSLEYNFSLKRNITVIKDDSGTGKSTLLGILDNYLKFPRNDVIKVFSDVPFLVCLDGQFDLVRYRLDSEEYSQGAVIFIEENSNLFNNKDFAKFIMNSGYYFVLVSREPVYLLPYSTKEIYKLESYYSTIDSKQYYTFSELYSNFNRIMPEFDLVILEDSNLGYTFFENFYNDILVTSAHGNSNILNAILTADAHNILCIVDGAAFGAFIERILKYCESNLNRRITLWMPESFEWVLLTAGVFKSKDLTKILENPSEYIECKDYASWERFFTALAEEYSQSPWKYNKNKLNSYYLSESVKRKVNNVLPKELQSFARFQNDNSINKDNNKETKQSWMNLF